MVKKALRLVILVLCVLPVTSAFAAEERLDANSWHAVSISGGYRTTTSVIDDTEITATFGKDGVLTGSAGCNDYTASVDVSGSKITIKPALTTQNRFDFPEGVMAQEELYLSALDSARYYRLGEGKLELLKANGKTAVLFVPVMPQNGIFLYKAGSKEVIIEAMADNKIVMTYEGGEYPMQLAITNVAAKYQASDGSDTSFGVMGESAFITVNGVQLPEYRLVMVSAVKGASGKKPDIYRNGVFEVVVEARDNDIIFLTANGETYLMQLTPSVTGEKYEAAEDNGTVFWVHGGEAVLTIKGRPYSAGTLVKEGALLPGAPQNVEPLIDSDAPEAVLLGSWRVETMDGRRPLSGTTITMTFTADGRLTGNASVNNFFASWIAEENRLVPGRLATTRIGGAPAHMKQEGLFLDMLDKAKAYEVRGNKLIITSGSGGQIVAGKL